MNEKDIYEMLGITLNVDYDDDGNLSAIKIDNPTTNKSNDTNKPTITGHVITVKQNKEDDSTTNNTPKTADNADASATRSQQIEEVKQSLKACQKSLDQIKDQIAALEK